MKVLVTGAGGQLGRALREVTAAVGFCGRGMTYPGDWIFTDLAELDITDSAAVEAFFECERPGVAVNCAAWTDVDGAEKEREAAFCVNRDAPRILAEAAARHGAAFVHVSTDFVFSGDGSRPYMEEDLPAPINVYGESKLAGERAVVESGCRGAIVRTSWLYSPWGKNFVKAILRVAAERPEIRVVSDQSGCPTSAMSLAGAIVEMLPSLGAMEIYHFCDAGVVNRADFAAEIIRLAGLECRVVPVASDEYPSIARRPMYSALDTGKITRDFGIVPRPWQEPLAGCVNELKKDGC